jgi:ferritin-like protein
MSDYHEPPETLPPEARDTHRALLSFKEEVEAVDWNHQRVVLCHDPLLQGVLAHNRDEEIEHACMTLEWLRRTMPGWDEQLRRYLFKEGPIHDRRAEGAESWGTSELGVGGVPSGGSTGRER